MRSDNIKNFKGGWFIGSFSPTFAKQDFEVAHHCLEKGHESDLHFHKESIEWNYIIFGKVRVDGLILKTGDMWEYLPGEKSNVQVLEYTELIVVKSKSVVNDKHYS